MVCVHEFLGTLVYESGGRSKIVHYWRMEASGGQVYELMDDVKAVDWLPLDAAVERLSRGYERAFLENVGPLALEAAALARLARPARAKKQPVPEKRRRRQIAIAPAAMPEVVAPPLPDVMASAIDQDRQLPVEHEVVETETSAGSMVLVDTAPSAEEIPAATTAEPAVELPSAEPAAAATARVPRITLVQKVRDWLRRAA